MKFKALLIPLINTLSILGLLGVIAYTQVIYKRPQITEKSERQRISERINAPHSQTPYSPTMVFEPFTVNIEPIPANPKAGDGTPQQLKGKLHYVRVGFALELREESIKEKIESRRPVFMDSVISTLGKKSFHDITTVHGRYLLRTELIDIANKTLAQAEEMKFPGVTNVYFTEFIVQ